MTLYVRRISLKESTPPPSAPSQFVVTPESGDQQVILRWAPPPEGTDSIDYRYKLDTAPTWTESTGSTSPAILGGTLPISGLTNGETYFFQVRAVNSAGTGPYSTSVAAVPDAASEPAAPTLTLVPVAGGVRYDWTHGNDNGASITGWQLDTTAFGVFDHNSPTATTFTVSNGTGNIEAAGRRLRAITTTGHGAWSNTAGPETAI